MDLSVLERNPTPYQLQLHRERREREARMKRAALARQFTRTERIFVPRKLLVRPAPPPVQLPAAPVMPVKPYVNKVKQIIRHVAARYNKTPEQILSKYKPAHLVHARAIAFYFLHKLTKRSLPQIGRDVGGRDHTTALHSIRKTKIRLLLDTRLYFELNAIESELTGEQGPIAFLPPPFKS